MLFIHTWEQVINGSKTATRRLWVDSDYTWMCGGLDEPPFTMYYSEICRENHTPRYRVGQRVAVMPARGVVGVRKVADFEIATLWRQDVREISEEDAEREGFRGDIDAFLETWCEMHDPSILPMYTAMYRRGWLDDRPADRYMAAVIEWQPESLVVYADAAATARALLAKAR